MLNITTSYFAFFKKRVEVSAICRDLKLSNPYPYKNKGFIGMSILVLLCTKLDFSLVNFRQLSILLALFVGV
jgi:hypothetical protein